RRSSTTIFFIHCYSNHQRLFHESVLQMLSLGCITNAVTWPFMDEHSTSVEHVAHCEQISVPHSPREVAAMVRERLQTVFNDRLRGVVLYGSEARGAATAESDIDVLVLLAGPIDYGSDLCACIDAVYPLALDWERPINPEPADIREFEAAEWPLYEKAKAEGILA
ncbi:MAG: nucleotidyltransferase domain-containing protein, partial [Verrucomicrobia bacterium]|nr:nucleotidyltransferase domain-containing protein [Verrucomicrobiota bacterium]